VGVAGIRDRIRDAENVANERFRHARRVIGSSPNGIAAIGIVYLAAVKK
jgi:hypothetical protein